MGDNTGVLYRESNHTRQCNMDLPSRVGSFAGWTNRPGSSSGATKDGLANLGCHLGTPGWTVQPWAWLCFSSSATVLQTPYYSRSSLRVRASPVLSRDRHEDVCVEKVSATM
jgi:hypothetical protein